MISSNSYVSISLRISNCPFFVIVLGGVIRGAVNLEGIESARVLNCRAFPSFRSVFLVVVGGVAGSYDEEDVGDGGERGEIGDDGGRVLRARVITARGSSSFPLPMAPSPLTSGYCFSVQAAAACLRAESVGGGKSAGSSP
jgi:hypothetical protein